MVHFDRDGVPSSNPEEGFPGILLQGVFNVLSEPVFVLDKEEAFVFANDAFAGLLQAGRASLYGETAEDWMPALLPIERWRRFVSWARSEGSTEERCRVRNDEGEEQVLLLRARNLATGQDSEGDLLVVELKEVTEQEELERRRKEAVALQEGLLGKVPASLCLCSADRQAYFFNEQWLTFTGRSLVEQLREGYLACVHPADRDRLQEALDVAMGNKENLKAEIRMRTARGNYRWMQMRGLFLEGAGEDEFVLAAVDVDELKKREQGLATILKEERLLRDRALEQKAAADRANREKSAYLSLASHEIRTPMNPVIGFADLLASNPNLDGDSKEMAEMILKSGKNLLLLIDEVLDFAKIESGALQLTSEPVDVHDLLIELDQQYAFDAKSRGLEWRVKDEVQGQEELYQDRMRLQQVLGTLLTHAIKFTHTGHVELKAELDEVEIQENTVAMLRFTIRDTGVGMNEEEQRILFKPFMQAEMELNEKYIGSGLGLAIAQKLVESMRGSLDVESEPQKGTTFRLTLPFTKVPEEERSHASVEGAQEEERVEQENPPSVIIVDDEESSRRVNSSLMRFLGYENECVSSGEELMGRMRRNSYDLILLDVMMQGMDGFQIARRVRNGEMGQENREAYIVAVTGCAQEEDRRLCLKAGCNAYVTKPLTIGNLKEALRGQKALSARK